MGNTSANKRESEPRPGVHPAAPEIEGCEPLTPKAALGEAARLGERIKEEAIDDTVGVFWAGFAYAPASGVYRPYRLGLDLHSGSCGIALFLAALERVTGGAGFRRLALEALRPLRHLSAASGASSAPELLRDLSIGALTGVGSLIYSLTRVGQLLDEPMLIEDARQLASPFAPDTICKGAGFDVTEGAAGALLGLLALHEATGDPHALELANACGLYLLAGRKYGSAGQRAWPTYEGRLLTGFSHGAAGIAYALVRLAAATGNRSFLDAATEGVNYERSVYDRAAKNWPDYRAEGTPTFSVAWCHGAPGVGLARLGGLDVFDKPDVRADIEAALETTLCYALRPRDHLCCGSLGTAEVLLTGGLVLGRPRLMSVARQLASFILGRARSSGAFLLPDALPADYASPGLFNGSAGIGYELLRLSFPEQLPSVLRFE